MSLRQMAESDLGSILEDGDSGFGWPIIVTNPAGEIRNLVGFSDDISQIIDPDTGQAVSGRLISVALMMSTLIDLGLGIPKGIPDSDIKPWIVTFDDINGNSLSFKVAQSNPDRALGLVICVLEQYEEIV